MLLYKIDQYEVHTSKFKTDNNYNLQVGIYKDGDLKTGWHEKETTKDIEILEAAINSIRRYEKGLKANTLEEFLNT